MHSNKTLVVFGVLCAMILGLANSGLHPVGGSNGYTGAPGDSSCSSCHSGSNPNINGEVSISGLPATILTGGQYTITVTVTNPNGNAVKAGFQMVALTGTNTNAGSMTNNSPNTEILTVFGGKKYFGHAPALDFPASNELSYTVDWTAPATTGSNPIIKFYASAVIANGNNSNSSDRVVLTNVQIPIMSSGNSLAASITNVFNASCSNSSDGSALATATGGSTPYSYSWNNGVNTAQNNSLPPGLAIVTVTDNTGTTATASATISSPPALVVSAFGSTVCQGATNGTASSVASGGAGSHFYNWSNGSTGSSIFNLPAGTYTVTVTDGNGCTKSANAVVTTSPNMVISESIINVTCNGFSNGSIFSSISGGTPGYTYLWSNGSTQNNISGLQAGNYTVTVTDAVLCTKTKSFTLTQPTPLLAGISNQVNVTCFGLHNGSATVTSSGGTPAYSYIWPNGATGTGFSNTQNNLAAGNYVVTVTDIFDCTTTVNFTITQPAMIAITALSLNPVSCFGNNDGSIEVVANGAVGNTSYIWSNTQAGPSIAGLTAGTYTVTVTGSGNGCTQTASYTITQPAALSIQTGIINQVTCFGGNNGSISPGITGGNGNNAYLWSNGASTPGLTGLVSGTYTLTVTDLEGCSATKAFVVPQAPAISIALVQTSNATCLGAANGSLSVSASNGNVPYGYLWSNGATNAVNTNLTAGQYTVTVTDNQNCTSSAVFSVSANASFTINLLDQTNLDCFGDSSGVIHVTSNDQFTYTWSNGVSTASNTGLPAGAYTVTATDAAGCQSVPLQVTISQPLPIVSTLVAADTLLCPGAVDGFITPEISGGTDSLEFEWSVGSSSLALDSLGAGIYTLSISDENNCLVTYSYEVKEAEAIVISDAAIQSVSCFEESNGSIDLSVTGGYGELEYQWLNTNNTTSDPDSLTAGIYALVITDEIGCMLTDTFVVNQPDSLYAAVVVTNESGAGNNDGSIAVTPTGGTGPFTITWNTGASTFILDSLSPGIYFYEIADFNGCTTEGWGIVSGGACSLTAVADVVQPTCFNSYDGAINLTIQGNFDAYTVTLFDGNEILSLPLDSLNTGTYTVVVSDSLQCSAIIPNIVLASPYAAIVLDSLHIRQPTTPTSNDGVIEAEVAGGEGGLSYLWVKDSILIGTNPIIGNLSVGTYTLIITDSVSCQLVVQNIILQAINQNEEVVRSAIQIYPNPVPGELIIHNTSGIAIESIQLRDISGRLMHTDASIHREERILYSLRDVTNYRAGIYLLRILQNGKWINKKITLIE